MFEHIDNVEEMCNNFPEIVFRHSSELKLIIQMATSPQYGSKIIEMSEKFSGYYDTCAEKISERTKKPYERIRGLIDLFVSCVVDCVIWNDREMLSKEIDLILKMMID